MLFLWQPGRINDQKGSNLCENSLFINILFLIISIVSEVSGINRLALLDEVLRSPSPFLA